MSGHPKNRLTSIRRFIPRRYMAAQLRRPTGLFGRRFLAPMLNQQNVPLNKAVLAALDLAPSDRVLEVGFGGGDLISRMLPLLGDGRIVGADFSKAMVTTCTRRFAPAIDEGRLSLTCSTVEALPLSTASVDKACSVNTIYFWPDAAAATGELHRVVAPGGRLVLGFAPRETLERIPVTAHGFSKYEVEEVAALLSDAGFVDVTFTMIEEPRGVDCCMVARKTATNREG